jgi:hypothetical protein
MTKAFKKLTAGNRIWILFSGVAVVLLCCAVMGTRTVRASNCTTDQCSQARIHALFVCGSHFGLRVFQCPYSSEPDDYLFICNDAHIERNDCNSNAPS